ncbi:MAG: helix-turn-helix transcriptional regulator [Acidobacteria bacterium]|nr:helix-turn-helix transcriptional regulator [Acidobacteriota bacterium]
MRDDTFGQELRCCELDGIRVAETCMPAGLRLDEHAHSRGQLCFVLEGTYRERLREEVRVLRPGFVHAREPGLPHTNAIAGDEDVITLLVSIDRSRWLPMEPWVGPLRLMDDVARELRAELRRDDPASRMALEGLTMLGLARLSRFASDGEPPWLGDAVAYIEHHYAEELTLQAVARAIGVHRATLAAAFRRHRRTSVGESIRAVRVERAKEVLAQKNVSLAEIALRTGFCDQSHFGRVFRASTGLTPAQWRAR